MKSFIFLLSSMLFTCAGYAQLSKYTFIREGGPLSPLNELDSSVTKHTVSNDQVLPAKVKIGFPFRFNGALYDSAGISENGYIWFGPAQASELAGIVNPMTANLPPSVKGVICAFGIDLHPHVNSGLSTKILSKTQIWLGQGNDFIVEWRNTTRAAALNANQKEDTMNVQIQLFAFEDDRAQITYVTMYLNPAVVSLLSVGMRGADQNDFVNRMTDATHPWDSTAAGSSLNSTCELSASSNPMLARHNYMSWINKNTSSARDKYIQDMSFHVYPQPAAGRLFIEANTSNKILSCAIYRPDGQFISEQAYSPEGIYTADLAAGLYLVKIHSSAGTGFRKFLKN